MGWNPFDRRSPIGLDLGRRSFKAVQLARRGGGWHVTAATEIVRANGDGSPPDAAEIRQLVGTLWRHGFGGDQAVIAAPEEKLYSSMLDAPPRESGAPIEQIARMELASVSRRDPQSLEVACWALPQSTSRSANSHGSLMAVGCGQDDADSVLSLFDGSGLFPVAMDLGGAALARVCAPAEDRIVPVLDLGWRSGRMTIVYGGVIAYQRDLIETAIEPLWQRLAREMNTEDEVTGYLLNDVGLGRAADAGTGETGAEQAEEVQTLVRDHFAEAMDELKLSFSYAQSQYGEEQLGQLVLVGGGAGIAGLPEHLSAKLEMEVVAMTPAERAQCPSNLLTACAKPSLTLATGLAMYEGEE
ncbi:MAG: pilus assembly protein PilM [Phycisphaerae bacterium]|nr:pilus assembly protein PilM [Phycisphaerae bacterium]